jgi:hypothetical protein
MVLALSNTEARRETLSAPARNLGLIGRLLQVSGCRVLQYIPNGTLRWVSPVA